MEDVLLFLGCLRRFSGLGHGGLASVRGYSRSWWEGKYSLRGSYGGKEDYELVKFERARHNRQQNMTPINTKHTASIPQANSLSILWQPALEE